MNWENQLSSILSVTDGSIAKMRERLTPLGKFSKEDDDLFPVRQSALGSDLDPPALSPGTRPHSQPSPALGSGVQWADLASVQSQLQIQSQAIESLTQKLQDLEKEKLSQQCHIQTLQDEVQRLREELRVRETWEDLRKSPRLEQRMEQWRREVGRELSSLRGHVKQATSLGNLEESFSTKLRREELEHLRTELSQLKTQLRRQEEDTYLQQAEARETRRQYERSCKTLENLTDSYRTHSSDLLKTLSQHSHTQQEMQQIRSDVLELKDEVRSLGLQGHKQTHLLSAHTSGLPPLSVPHTQKTRVRAEEADSDSEDFSPTPSLAEISSDDLSWLDDKNPAPQPRARLSIRSRPSDFTGPESDEENHHDDHDDDDDDLLDDDDDDDDNNPELGSDLSLNDL